MSHDERRSAYDAAFFDWQVEGALRSARVVVPVVLEYLQPLSVLDVGCGRGAWLRVFQDLGIENVAGVDGDYLDCSTLLISAERFQAVDLQRPEQIRGTYDLSICLEVGEHLPLKVSRPLVDTLTKTAPAVLFSAAVPGQGGTHHVNEQWPPFWDDLFSLHGFRPLGVVRARILSDHRVEWWYRQNIVLYASGAALTRWPRLSAAAAETPNADLEWVHVSLLRSLGSAALIQFLGLDLVRRIRRRFLRGGG